MTIGWPFAPRVWLKSPARSSAVGTVASSSRKLFCRSPSYDTMKNVRSRAIGPPVMPPN